MQKSYYILLLSLLLIPQASAQTGTCEGALGEAMLEGSNVRARMLNNGALFWRGSPHVYRIPKDGNSNAVFAASLWISGKVDGKIRSAASRYGPWEFWAGPLDETGAPPADCKPYDRIWEIRPEDVATFLETGEISNNLKSWPWQLGAPVIDGDGNPDNYNLQGGDQPQLLGDQHLWWIMNDRGNVHEATDSEPLGIEVRVSAHAYKQHNDILGNNTFYRYRVTNRNDVPIEDAYFGFYVDPDLGNFDDDYIGSDSLLHLGYFYNADNDDEGGEGYGAAPPAAGFTFLRTPVAKPDNRDSDYDGEIDEALEELGMTAFACIWKWSSPRDNEGYYNCLRGLRSYGDPIYEGGYGEEGASDKTTKYVLSGDPVTKAFWSEFNVDGMGTPLQPADRRLMLSTGPFDIQPDSTQEIDLAVVWSRGVDHLDSVTELKKDTRVLHNAGNALWSAQRLVMETEPEIEPGFVLGFDQNFPNPFSQSTTLRYSLPQSMQVRLRIFNLLGREVALLVNSRQEAGIYTASFDAGNLPAGVYIARIELDYLQFTKRMVLMR